MILLRFIILFLTGIFFSGSLAAQPAIIRGNAPDYAGVELVFYQYTDYISYTEKESGRTLVKPNGDFELQFDISEITYLFFPLGVFKAYLFLVPNKTFEVLLPARKDKSVNEKINPFFRETFVHIAVINEADGGLNRQIAKFDIQYDKLFSDLLHGSISLNSSGKLDSLIMLIEHEFAESIQYDFFDAYREYRYGFLQHVTMQQKSRSISDNFFLNRPVLYNNPAYMELFNQLYNKYFLFFGRTEHGKKIYEDIGKYKSLSMLKNTLSTDAVLKEENLLEMVILKGLHDGFYDDDFSRSNLLVILDSLQLSTSNPRHSEIAKIIRTKVTQLMVGYEPPFFQLYDNEGNLKSLADFKGKYIYLNFCTPASYSCLREFEMLQWLRNKHKAYLEIVTILVDESLESMQNFLKIKPYDWPFLYFGDRSGILNKYDVRTFPTYYLIDRKGKLILSPAPGPSENFEQLLFQIMRANREL